MKNNKCFEKDKKEIILEIEEAIKVFPENKNLQKLLNIVERTTSKNINGGLSYFIVDSFSGNYELGEKIIRFEQKYRNSITK